MKILRRLIIAVLPVGVLMAGFLSCRSGKPGAAPAEPSVITSTGTIGVGGSLSDSLGSAGVPPLESAQVERTLKPLYNPRYSKAQDKYEVLMSTSGHLAQ